MEIGTKFTFLSSNQERTAIFLEEENGRITAFICDDVKFHGLKVSVDKENIIKTI
jgi:hypothetical protein